MKSLVKSFSLTAISVLAKEAQPGQSSTQAIYPLTFTDGKGNPLNGANRYTLRFEKGKTRPVNAFWSLTFV